MSFCTVMRNSSSGCAVRACGAYVAPARGAENITAITTMARVFPIILTTCFPDQLCELLRSIYRSASLGFRLLLHPLLGVIPLIPPTTLTSHTTPA